MLRRLLPSVQKAQWKTGYNGVRNIVQAPNAAAKAGILGVCCEKHGSFLMGPAKGPPLIRDALASKSLNDYSELGNNAMELMKDFGDVRETDFKTTEAMHEALCASLQSILDEGLAPVVLGGDHHISNPIVKHLAKHWGQPLAVVQFDAHNDLYEDYEGDYYSHASPFARILEAGPTVCSKLVQLGIRTATPHNRKQAERYNVSMVEMRNMPETGKAVAGLLDALLPPDCLVYISFDLDALDPAHAPAVSHWEAGGMTTRQALDIIHMLRRRVIGADIVEYNPDREVHGMTAMVAAKLVREICTKISLGCKN